MSDMGKDKTNRMTTENKAPVILVWILLGVILGAGGGYFFPSFMLGLQLSVGHANVLAGYHLRRGFIVGVELLFAR